MAAPKQEITPLNTYIGIEFEKEDGADVCVEFDVSMSVFVIAYTLSQLCKEKSN